MKVLNLVLLHLAAELLLTVGILEAVPFLQRQPLEACRLLRTQQPAQKQLPFKFVTLQQTV